MTIHETHKHYFQVTDLGDTDNDTGRSIVPSINSVLQNEGIDCVVDGDEMNQAGFTVWTYSPRDVVAKVLQDNDIELEKQMKSLKKKTKKKKEDKLTKEDWIELLNFWPMTIVVPIMLILILFGPWIMS